MVDSLFDRCRPLRATLVVAAIGIALYGRAFADDVTSLDTPEKVVLPSQEAAPTNPRFASRQPLPTGAQPLPPGLLNNTPNINNLPRTNNMPGMTGLSGNETVVDIKFDPPLKEVKEQDARRQIKTIPDRPYDERTIQDDVRRLRKSNLFGYVDVSYQRVSNQGVIVIYHVVELPTIRYVRFFGQQRVKERHLKKQSGLKVGDHLQEHMVDDAKNKVEEYYREKGFNKATVKIIEGKKKGDRGAVFLVNEGQKQKVWKVEFEGNTIASDDRLKTQIQSKPPLLYLFKGEVDRQKIEEDIARLTEYYRGLGFFRARISRELQFNADNSWLTVRFIIDEGPRYKVRDIKFVGNKLFTEAELKENLKLKAGDYFDQSKLGKDRSALTDKYGVKGYVFSVVEPQPIFQSDPNELDQLDLVYQVEEGRRCVVARVDVKVAGDNPHTRRNTILNRVSLHPGDLLSTREVRDSERRLKGAGIFKNTPGDEPKIELHRPEVDVPGLANQPGGTGSFRGQSPDPGRRGAR